MGRRLALHVAEQPHRLLAHPPDALHGLGGAGRHNLRAILLGFVTILGKTQAALRATHKGRLMGFPTLISRHREAAPAGVATFTLHHRGDACELGLELPRIVGQQLDEIDTARRA